MLYVPILKCKQGEKDALYQLTDHVKDNIVPLLEITPDVIAKENFSGVEDFWEGRPFIFDISPEYYEELTDDEYFTILSKCNIGNVIPTIKLSDNEEKIEQLVSRYSSGVALRLYLEEIMDDDFENNYEEFSDKLDIANTDLIIDAQEVDPNKVNETSFLIKSALDLINNISQFRNVVLSSNSFPKSLSEVERHIITTLPRVESKLYNKLKPYFEEMDVKVIYSDYAINHWTYFDYVLGMQPSFNIRYTSNDYYVIYKGDTNKKGGLKIEKVKRACNLLVSSQYFKDKDYSWGDNEIFDKAHGNSAKSGNLTTWRAIGTNHHISFIVDLLSNQS